MKITKVECIPLQYITKAVYINGFCKNNTRNVLVVKVYTDAGLVGIGESAAFGGPSVSTKTIIEQEIAPRIIGEDPLRIEYIWHKLMFQGYQHSRGGVYVAAVSGVDIALWDILGKVCQQPVYKLLGGFSERCEIYACGGFYEENKDNNALCRELKSYVDEGFRAVKIKVGRTYTPLSLRELSADPDLETLTFNEDMARVEAAVNSLGSNVRLMVDANANWTYPDAIRAGKIFEEMGVYLFEEPMRTDDYRGLSRLCNKLSMRIAGYETETLISNMSMMIDEHCMDVVQSDVCWSGGLTGIRKIAGMAEARYMEFMPHCFVSGIGMLASLHLACGVANAESCEWDMSDTPFLNDLLVTPIQRDGCFVKAPDAPGLGVELREDILEKYAVFFSLKLDLSDNIDNGNPRL